MISISLFSVANVVITLAIESAPTEQAEVSCGMNILVKSVIYLDYLGNHLGEEGLYQSLLYR